MSGKINFQIRQNYRLRGIFAGAGFEKRAGFRLEPKPKSGTAMSLLFRTIISDYLLQYVRQESSCNSHSECSLHCVVCGRTRDHPWQTWRETETEVWEFLTLASQLCRHHANTDIQTLWRSCLSVRVPRCQKL